MADAPKSGKLTAMCLVSIPKKQNLTFEGEEMERGAPVCVSQLSHQRQGQGQGEGKSVDV